MSKWWKVYDDVLDDPTVQMLSPRAFMAALRGAMRGEETPFSRFIKPGRDRPSGQEWVTLRGEIFKRDDFTCQYCGERGERLECDHVVPVSRGGASDPDNLTTACFACNRSKRDKLVSEWLG